MLNNQYGKGDNSYLSAGEEAGIRRLVDDFYALMGSEARYQSIWEMHPDDKLVSRDKLACFLCGWLGGPKLYHEKYGAIGIPRVHAHLAIRSTERDLWLSCMEQAVAKQPYADDFKSYLMKQFFVPAEAVRRRCE